jgi:hypothetical protein
MDIWQRGTSVSAGGYTADGFVVTGVGTISRQTFTPGAAPVAGYESQYYLNWLITTNQQNSEIIQRVENVRTFAGNQCTVSFWARSTVGAQLENFHIYQSFGTGGSPSSLVDVFGGTFTPTATWTRYTFTFTMPSIAGKTIGTNNDSFIWLRLAQHSATTTTTSLDLWGVQMELGGVATAFSTATGNPAGELALCQRYYYRLPATTSAYAGLGTAYSTTAAAIQIPLKVTMRTVPTVIDFSSPSLADVTNAAINATAVTIGGGTSADLAEVLVTGAVGLTQYRPYYLAGSTGAGYVGVGAEL